MFNNIGKKIKGLAVVIFVIDAIAAFCVAMWLCDEVDTVLGIGAFLGLVLVAWISVFFIYGFGELIDRTTDIDKKLSMMVPAAVSHPPVHGVPVDCAPAPAVAPVQVAPVVAPPPVPAKPYYDISRSQKPSVGVGKCPICRQANLELWECVIKEGDRYSQKNICQGCIETYQKAAKQ